MNVFIMRHGEAQSSASSDAERQLTENGCADILAMAKEYGTELSEIDVIWASPYIRAQQTAQLLSHELKKDIVTKDFLPPSGNPVNVWQALEGDSKQTILLVSHQPLVSILVDGLAGLEPGRYRMGTGALACLSTDVYANGCGDLLWLHQPSSLQQSAL